MKRSEFLKLPMAERRKILEEQCTPELVKHYEELVMKPEEELMIALRESVKLQTHYARLLNGWDGGKRMKFVSLEHWIERLRETGDLPPHPEAVSDHSPDSNQPPKK